MRKPQMLDNPPLQLLQLALITAQQIEHVWLVPTDPTACRKGYLSASSTRRYATSSFAAVAKRFPSGDLSRTLCVRPAIG
jgi:hypothetical protein